MSINYLQVLGRVRHRIRFSEGPWINLPYQQMKSLLYQEFGEKVAEGLLASKTGTHYVIDGIEFEVYLDPESDDTQGWQTTTDASWIYPDTTTNATISTGDAKIEWDDECFVKCVGWDDTENLLPGCDCSVQRALENLLHSEDAESPFINELAAMMHAIAEQKGWFDNLPTALELLSLVHTEVSEASECVRTRSMSMYYEDGKPEGFPVELADIILRVCTIAEHWNVDLEQAIMAKLKYLIRSARTEKLY